jgi:hypothetical protein
VGKEGVVIGEFDVLYEDGETDLQGRAEALATTLYSLEEPWRSRFLTLVANMSTEWTWSGHLPQRHEIVDWLGDRSVYYATRTMLQSWHKM